MCSGSVGESELSRVESSGVEWSGVEQSCDDEIDSTSSSFLLLLLLLLLLFLSDVNADRTRIACLFVLYLSI